MDKMNGLYSLIRDEPYFSLDFPRTAMEKILKITREDIRGVRAFVTEIKDTFDSVFGDIVRPTVDLVKHFRKILKYQGITLYRSRDDKDGLDGSHNVLSTMNLNYLLQIKAIIVKLVGYLEELHITMVVENTTNTEETLRKYIPLRVWYSSNLTQNCDDGMFNETREYTILLGLIDNTLENYEKLNVSSVGSVEWPKTLQSSVWARYNSTEFMLSCISKLQQITEKGHEDMSNLYAEVDEAVTSNELFRSHSFHETVKSELNWINAKSKLMKDMLANYSQYAISKHQMRFELKHSNLKHSVKSILDTMLSRMDTGMIMKLQIQSEGMKNNVHKWLKSLLKITTSMVNYYENEFVENKTRNLAFWKKPVPDTGVPDQLRYEETDTCHTWPLNLTLREFASHKAPRVIASILENYIDESYQIIHRIKNRMLKASDQVRATISLLDHEMVTYKQQLVFNENFVR